MGHRQHQEAEATLAKLMLLPITLEVDAHNAKQQHFLHSLGRLGISHQPCTLLYIVIFARGTAGFRLFR